MLCDLHVLLQLLGLFLGADEPPLIVAVESERVPLLFLDLFQLSLQLFELLAVALAGGGAAYFLKFKKKKPDTKGDADLDDYDYGDQDEYSDAEDEPEDGEDE